MLITFIRRRVVTKMIGYLTMENGVLMFGVFLTELPLIIEVLILVDLLILVLLGTMLALGMDSSIEDFQTRLHPFAGRREDD
jgi:hydrogenase-4 component E